MLPLGGLFQQFIPPLLDTGAFILALNLADFSLQLLGLVLAFSDSDSL